MRLNAVKRKLRSGGMSVGSWLSLGNVLAARYMAGAGFDWLNVDLEHSATDVATAAHMFAAVADAGTNCVPLARVPSNRHDHFKRVLDAGAMGVIVPMVMNRAEAAAAVDACWFPPRGSRSVGGTVAAMNFAMTPAEYLTHADDELLIVLQCEHIDVCGRIEEVFAVPGVDVVFIGPADLKRSMFARSGAMPSDDDQKAARAEVVAACRRLGVAPGIHCANAAEARQRRDEGFRFLALGSEQTLMLEGTAAALAALQ